MNRYKFTPQYNYKYNNTYLPLNKEYEQNIEYITIISKSSDNLMSIANIYYKDVSLWWIIAKFNNLPGNSAFVDSGIILKIPLDYIEILNKLKEKN